MNYTGVPSPDFNDIMRDGGIESPTWGHAVLAGWILYASTGDLPVTIEALRHAYWLLTNTEERDASTTSLWILKLLTILGRKHNKEE